MNETSAHTERSAGTSGRRLSDRSTPAGLQIELPADALEQIVAEVIERVKRDVTDASPWMARGQAANYLAVPVSRLEKDRTVPMHRWDGRVFYHRAELDEWLRAS